MVTGPLMSAMVCLVKFFSRECIRVVLPTLGGPTTATTYGGGSTGLLSTSGARCFLVSRSFDRRKSLAARTEDLNVNALRFLGASELGPEDFFFFLSALGPACLFLCDLFLSSSSAMFSSPHVGHYGACWDNKQHSKQQPYYNSVNPYSIDYSRILAMYSGKKSTKIQDGGRSVRGYFRRERHWSRWEKIRQR